jgi:hypothetical protein
MANTQSMCTSFLGELMTATHNFGTSPVRAASTADSFKAALYFASATLNASTTVYSATGEVTNTSGTGYTAGGTAITSWNAPTATNASSTAGVGFTTPTASFSWTALTITSASFDTVFIYNATQANKAVSVHTFTGQTITAGTFTLTMPSNTTTTALLRLATT